MYGLEFNHLPIVSKKEAPKVDYEYQAVCLECIAFFGEEKESLIWAQPYRKGITENLIRFALKECRTRNKPYVGYFLKIIDNKLKNEKQQRC